MGAADASLLRDHRNGLPGAADELARRALRIALRTATGMLRDRELAADVAQETAIDVLRGVRRLNDPGALDAWIHRIAVRNALRAVRRHRDRGRRERPLDDLPASLEADPTAPAALEVVERGDLADAVRSALLTLPPKQRMALVLRHVHDMSYEQIAAAMGERTGTVGVLISRARAALRAVDAVAALNPGRSKEDG